VLNLLSAPAITIFVPFSFVHAFTLFGAIYFNKLHFIKTGFVFFISLAVLVVANTLFLQGLLGQSMHPAVPFTNVSFNKNNNFYDINLTSNYAWLVFWLIIAVSILLWVAAYFRLKEKQV
jgi:hypothetical protein